MVFSTSSKKPYTPPEWAGTLLRACFAVRKQSLPQVKAVEGTRSSSPWMGGWGEGEGVGVCPLRLLYFGKHFCNVVLSFMRVCCSRRHAANAFFLAVVPSYIE
jgi:hypothetical protein